MKGKYEDPFRNVLPQRTNLIIRIDGRAFHTFTKPFKRPYDEEIHEAMSFATRMVCEEIGGCKFAYTQSDEASFLATDYDTHETQMWFGGNKAKIETIAASAFTAFFNYSMMKISPTLIAQFDARAFIIPTQHEVVNYFIWRQQDAIRNSVSMLARHHFSAKRLHKVSSKDAIDLLRKEKKVRWEEDTPAWFRRGTALYKKAPGRHKVPNWYTDKNIPEFVGNQNFVRQHMPIE